MSYRLRFKDDNWRIEKRHVKGEDAKNPGEVYWTVEGYYGLQLTVAAKRLLQLEISEEMTTGLRSLIEAVEDAESTVLNRVEDSLEEASQELKEVSL